MGSFSNRSGKRRKQGTADIYLIDFAKNGDAVDWIIKHLTKTGNGHNKHNDDDATKDIIETLGKSLTNRSGKGRKQGNDDDATKDIIETIGKSFVPFIKGRKQRNDDDATKDIIETLGGFPKAPTNVPNDDDVPDDIIETLDGKTNKAPGEGHAQPKFQLRGAVQV
jgi:hypothetical protein